MKKIPKDYCRSFKPFVDEKSRVLVLGSMPGPMALRKQEYYGFTGNHFWSIMPSLFNEPKPTTYEEKLALIRRHRIALWDVLESCIRPGAADSDISKAVVNPIPELLSDYPGIRAVFVNGQTAHKMFVKAFGSRVKRPVFYLPSSSPAHAAMTLPEKIKRWSVILEFLNPSEPIIK